MHDKVKEFKVNVEVIAEMTVINPFDFFVDQYAEKFPFQYIPQDIKELKPYFEIIEDGPLLKEWLKKVEKVKVIIIVDFLVAVNYVTWLTVIKFQIFIICPACFTFLILTICKGKYS